MDVPIPPTPDVHAMLWSYFNSFIGLADKSWMIWVFTGVIVISWIATILIGYFFRRGLFLFILTVALSYVLVGISSIMIYRIAMTHGGSGDSSSSFVNGDSEDEVTVYHKKKDVTPSPSPTEEPQK